MKKSNVILILFIGIFFSCNTGENDIVPDFLNGSQYGVLLDVNVTGNNTANVANIDTYRLDFEVSYKGDKRAVKSITINKIYQAVSGEDFPLTEQQTLTKFPAKVSLTFADLVKGISNLTTGDLQAGDTFKIMFIVNYEDGGIVSRFDPTLRTNFSIYITNKSQE